MIDQTLGSYRIIRQLGAGAMGEVYLAEHRHLRRKAALKLLAHSLVGRPELLERFFLEARATSAIQHPGIVQIFDCEVDANGRPYIVMEYLEGETLAARLTRARPLSPALAARVAEAMASALAAAHEKEIIHRDLKPENVFVDEGPPVAIKVVDFGIAKLAGDFRAEQVHQTRTGSLMGTPLYMSPEQCKDAARIDFRTDIYSLGCVLYEMLTGQTPFTQQALGELLVAHLTEMPKDARVLAPTVPSTLADLCARMLQKDPNARPASMRAVSEQLRNFLLQVEGTIVAPTPPVSASTTAALEPRGRVTTTFGEAASEIIDSSSSMTTAPRRSPLRVALGAFLVGATLIGLWVGVAKLRNQQTVAAAPPATTTSAPEHLGAAPRRDDLAPPTKGSTADTTKEMKAAESIKTKNAGEGGVDKSAAARKKGPHARSERGERGEHDGSRAPAEDSPPPVTATREGAGPSEMTGVWEGPWQDPAKQQKGRLFIQVSSDMTVRGWMSNEAARQSFQLSGRLKGGSTLDLACQCPPERTFSVRGAVQQVDDNQMKASLSLSSSAGVFGQSHASLRRTSGNLGRSGSDTKASR